MLGVDWQSVAALVTVSVIGGGLAFALIRARLSSEFVTRNDHDQVLGRLGGIEQRLSGIPQHTDLMAVERRVAEVAREVGATNAFVQSLKDDTGRIQHQLNMLIEAKLTEEREPRR